MSDLVTTTSINLEKTINVLIDEIINKDFSKETIGKSKISMSLTLINIAIKSIPRIVKLNKFTDKLEEKIFDEKRLLELSHEEAIDLYMLANSRINQSIDFTSRVLNGIKWSDLENAIVLLNAQVSSKKLDADSNQKALDILSTLDNLKKIKS